MWTRASSAMLWSRSLPTADRVQSCFVVRPLEVAWHSQAVHAHGHERSMDSLLTWAALPDDQSENEPNCWFEDLEMQREVCE